MMKRADIVRLLRWLPWELYVGMAFILVGAFLSPRLFIFAHILGGNLCFYAAGKVAGRRIRFEQFIAEFVIIDAEERMEKK